MPIDPARLQEALGERYRIERELGRGGFATVFRVWNPRLERAEALKVLAPGHEADEDFPRRFTQEVRLAAALEHRSIVKVYDFGQAGDLYWYSMQLVDGQTLSAELREKGPMRERDLARIAIPLLDALDYSHARGIVHRDIKPENVILDAGRQPFLMDFGIAKSAGSLVKTQTGFLLGTPAYVAPEQAQGKPLDGRADLYALGVTLYRVASGRYPFEAQDPLQAVILRLTQPPRPLSEARPGVDPDFASIVMRALERQTSRRWESARAMRGALAAWLSGKPAEAEQTRVLDLEEAAAAQREPLELPPDATVLGPATGEAPAAAEGPTLVRPGPPARPAITSALGAPSGRARIVPFAAGILLVLVLVSGTGLLLLRKEPSSGVAPADVPSGARPAATAAPTPPAALPTAEPVPPTAVPASSPASDPEPSPTPLRILRPTRAPEPPPVVPRPVTGPERLTPDPPFAGAPPAGCSGASVAVGFAVDAEGNVVSPRLFPSGAAPECGRFVLEALPRWKWRPAVDAQGSPVLSARLLVSVQLP